MNPLLPLKLFRFRYRPRRGLAIHREIELGRGCWLALCLTPLLECGGGGAEQCVGLGRINGLGFREQEV